MKSYGNDLPNLTEVTEVVDGAVKKYTDQLQDEIRAERTQTREVIRKRERQLTDRANEQERKIIERLGAVSLKLDTYIHETNARTVEMYLEEGKKTRKTVRRVGYLAFLAVAILVAPLFDVNLTVEAENLGRLVLDFFYQLLHSVM